MLNPLLQFLRPALGTLGIKPVFTMIGLKELAPYHTNNTP